MRFRLVLPLSMICSFIAFVGVLLLAQSDPAPVVNQPSGIPPGTSGLPRGLRFNQRKTTGAKATATRSDTPQASGLNFAPAVVYGSGGYGAYSVAVADLAGNGIPDLVVANLCSSSNGNGCTNVDGGVSVLLGNGNGTGTFQDAVPYSSGGYGASSVAVADLTGNGIPDLVVVNSGIGNNDASVGVLLGNGDGTFQTAVTYPAGDWAFSVAVADVNGDGKLDLVVANNCVSSASCSNGVVNVLLGNGDGTFQTAVTYSSGGSYAFSVALGDVNGDGKPDIVVANNSSGTVGVLLNNGDGTFPTVVTYGSGGPNGYSVAVGDVNGDGKPDIVVVNSNGTVGVLVNNGNGTFKTAVTYGSGSLQSTSLVLADVNGDGTPDIVVGNIGSGGDSVVGVLLGTGNGTFQTAVAFDSGLPGIATVSVAVADVNGDGKPDLLATNFCASSPSCTTGTVSVLLNTSLYTSPLSTATAMVSSLNPSNFGQAATFTATITHQQGATTPTGTVSFFDGTTNIGNSPLNGSGVAALTISTLAVGTHSITATYSGDANFAASTSFALNQSVRGAVVALSPTNLTFGNQNIGVSSTSQTVTLVNTAGNVSLTITSVGITGTNSGDFAQTNNCSGSVAPNGSCTISVTFTPSASGARSAAVTVMDNGSNSPQSASLTGTGGASVNLYSPVNGSTLTSSAATFEWSAYPNATAYWLDVGAAQGGNTYFQSGNLSSSTLSCSVSALPADGSTVWARWYYLVGGTWGYTDYSYTAFGAAASRGAITSPTPGSTLTGSMTTFAWSAGSGATAYSIDVGSTVGGNNYYQSGNLGNVLSKTVTTLPTNGTTVYVTLYSMVNGTWFSNAYQYAAYDPAGMMQTPVPGSTLTGNSATFSWSAGSGASAYWVDVGNTPGGNQYLQSGNLGNVQTLSVKGLPTDGSTIYVTLYSLIGDTWTWNAYTYTALNATSGLAVMQTPTPGSTLNGSTATFTWSNDPSATSYWVDISAENPGGNDVYQSGSLGDVLHLTVSTLPANGSTIYVTLYSLVGGQWSYTQSTYTSGP